MADEKVLKKAKELDTQIEKLREILQKTEQERRDLDSEIFGCFVAVTATGSSDYWTEYYTPYMYVTEEFVRNKVEEHAKMVNDEYLTDRCHYYFKIDPNEHSIYDEAAFIRSLKTNYKFLITLDEDQRRSLKAIIEECEKKILSKLEEKWPGVFHDSSFFGLDYYHISPTIYGLDPEGE